MILPKYEIKKAPNGAFFINRLLLLTNSYKEQLIDIIFVFNLYNTKHDK